MQFLIGNDKDYAANRISYKLDLKGPSIVVQSACSSSLLAVHTAGQSCWLESVIWPWQGDLAGIPG
jgi:acyl transferase domain-containing protein